MPTFRQVAIAGLLAVTLVSCRRDPNSAKAHYLESGNKYAEHERYKQAIIQYQNAIKIDPKFGPAHYKLALIYLKIKPAQVASALKEYRKAKELLANDQAYQEEYKQSLIRLAELELFFLKTDKLALDDVGKLCEDMLKKEPNSFDGLRLSGDLDYTRAQQELVGSSQADQLYASALENYRKADAVKPDDPGVSMQIGLVLWQQKHLADAERYLRKVVAKDKTGDGGYLNLYRLYMSEQKTAEAEQLLKEAIQNNPKSYQYLERLAAHYGSLGRRDEMLNVLQQIKAHGKDFESVNQVVGDFYLRTGDADSALREYREGIVNDSQHKANYQHSIIEVLLRQGKRAEAAEVNAQVLKENPKDVDARSLAATFLLDQGDINNALAQLQSVVNSAPDNAVAHYELGRAYLATGRSDSREAGRHEFETAIRLRPDMISPRLGLAELQVSHAEYQGALDTVQEVIKRDPQNLNARLIQSQAYVGQQKYGESNSLVAAMLKAAPSSPEVYYQAGMSAMAQSKPKDAEAAFMRSYELNPNNSKGLLGVVNADIEQNRPEAAMAMLQAESKKYPNRLDLPLLMGITAVKQSKFNEGIAYFTRVLNGLDKKNTARADLYLQIANTYRLAGDRDAAISNVIKAREIKPDSEVVLSALALLEDQSGKKTDARKAYEASLKVNPNNAFALNNLAYLMAENNSDLDIALGYAQKAKQLSPNQAEIADTYGWILLKKGLAENAVPVFKDLVMRNPGNSTYHYHLAMAYKQKSDAAKALEECREAMKHSPAADEMRNIQEMMGSLGAK